MINRTFVRVLTLGLAIVAVVPAAPAAAQQNSAPAALPTTHTMLGNDVGNLSDKYVGLARVMAGKYDWRPGPGVRSVGEVLNLIVNENRMLNNLLTGAPNQGKGGMGGGTPITDPAELQEAIRSTYATLRKTIEGLSDTDWHSGVRMFGRDLTKQGATLMLLLDQHEHLGQSIAYARSNNVVPPWSK